MSCWLCQNIKHEEVVKMNMFMQQHITCLSTDEMIEMVTEKLQKVEPSLDKPQILKHLQGHNLHPQLQTVLTLRSLVEIRNSLQSTLLVIEEDGSKTIDARNMAAYLKVASEIAQYYRSVEKYFTEKG